ncbi:MAG TPA: hydrogenase maturation nickel metallochaperone HypA [Gemmatimonadaceae bacterium]|nr:hydrogenase maturation nickel metallochaperone HypA [Gemmatimonadaceae bacterium]
MHELAIADSVARIVLDQAAGRRVTRVGMRIGHLRQVVPSALTFSFELLVQGTDAEGATLDIEAVEAAGECRRCGVESRLAGFPLSCGACGSLDIQVVRGEELLVDWVEIDDAVTTSV